MGNDSDAIMFAVAEQDVEIACELGVGPAWQRMSDNEKAIRRKHFRLFLQAYGVRHAKTNSLCGKETTSADTI